MAKRGRLAGYNWHIEYHSDPKKAKAADCIYLTKDRICQNKKSPEYMGKCFVATTCPLRVRQKEADRRNTSSTQSAPKKEPPIKKIRCSLPIGCEMYSNAFGQGKLIDYDESGMHISVQFEKKIVRFQYPNAIIDKYLIVSKSDFKTVQYDTLRAER